MMAPIWLMTAIAVLAVGVMSTHWAGWRLDQGEGYLPGDWFLIPLVSTHFRASSLLARYIFRHVEIADALWRDADALVRLNVPE